MAKSAPKKSTPAARAAKRPKPMAAKGAKSPKAKAKPLARKKVAPAPAKKAKVVRKPVKVAAKPAAKPAKGAVAAKKVVAKKTTVARPTTKAKPKSAPAPRPAPVAAVVAPKPEGPAKPKRNGSGLGSRDLQHFADLLLIKRREIVGDMHSMEGEALRSGTNGLSTLPVHMADMGTDNYEQEFTLGLVEKDRTLLREINHALAKIVDGTYGICEGTSSPIGKPRLEVQPWARYGIEYARLRERNGRGVRMF